MLFEAYERLSAAPPLVLIGTMRGATYREFPPNVTAAIVARRSNFEGWLDDP